MAASDPGATPGRFPQIGGMAFSFDPARPAGDRVRSLAVLGEDGTPNDIIVKDGAVVGDSGRPIRLVTLNFLAGGGDGYAFDLFGEDLVNVTNAAGEDMGEQEAMALYLAANFAETPYARSETPITQDTRIQNLTARPDTVLSPLPIELNVLGGFSTGIFDEGAAEIVAHDPASQRLFFTNANSNELGILDMSDPANLSMVSSVDLSPVRGGPNSVSAANGTVAVAVEAENDVDNGSVVLFDVDGTHLKTYAAGNLPDMVTFTPDGSKLVVANEGEPTSPAIEAHARFATFNVALNRFNAGDLLTDLEAGDEQAMALAQIIQRNQPDVILLNEFDFDVDGAALSVFQQDYLEVSQNGEKPVFYDHVFVAPSNTGIDSGFDLDNNDALGQANDAFGFGFFEGQYGMALLSKYPIVTDEVRTFQNFLWKDMPGAMLPDDLATEEPADWYSPEELEVVRLSSKSHWDVPISVDGETIHVLASHPTPPVFDGPEDRNGTRNHDEIRFWADYVTPGQGDYIYDDAGRLGGLNGDARFVIMGDLNADPFDGDSTDNAILNLLANPMINTDATPASDGGAEAAELQGDANAAHLGDSSHDTADFNDGSPGNLRADYVLPSDNLIIENSGVYWPVSTHPEASLTGNFPFPSSDHRLVFADLRPRGIDPPGSITVIDVTTDEVTQLDFSEFVGREEELRSKGVRIFPGKSAYHDLEPEFAAISADGTHAFVTLQEANSVAVVNLGEAPEIVDIVPLGSKDHSRGLPEMETYPVVNLPALGETPSGQSIAVGGFSGLFFAGHNEENGNMQFLTIPDRGPNPDTSNFDADGDGVAETVRPLALPEYQSRIVVLELDSSSGEVSQVDEIFLTRTDPENEAAQLPITGLPNLVRDLDGNQIDEFPVDLSGNPIPLDPFGGDMEAIVIQSGEQQSYWTADEYRPAIYHFDSTGNLIKRLVPEGTATLAGEEAGAFGIETIPEEYVDRRRNRGFEALALNEDSGTLYAFIQTPLANPDRAASNGSAIIRVLAVNAESGEAVGEYVYLLEDLDARPGSRVDKIGDAVHIDGDRFYVLERDSSVGAEAKKLMFEIDLTGATNLLEHGDLLTPGKTLEQHTVNELAAVGIRPIHKDKIANLASLGYQAGDKPEGLALLPDGAVAILNDNDFQLEGGDIFDASGVPLTDGAVFQQTDPTPTVLGILRFADGSGLDVSNRDDAINIDNHPVRGLFMPDAITSVDIAGQTYFLTANEGDARDADVRIGDLTLDPTVFPDAAELQDDAELGRLNVSSVNGDLDGDGDFDKLYSYGTRSFTIFDQYGNLVFDSGDDFEQLTAALVPDGFNSTNDENAVDDRSDDKGPEPEAITTGIIGGSTFAFVGLERVGGIMVYDISDPTSPGFVQYLNNRDFSVAPTAEDGASNPLAGDLGVEDLKFIPGVLSPTGSPLLVAANEVSGTITTFSIDVLLEPVTSLAGDLNSDGTVDFADFLVMSENFGHSGDASVGDIDGNGQVGFEDFLQLSMNFGNTRAADDALANDEDWIGAAI